MRIRGLLVLVALGPLIAPGNATGDAWVALPGEGVVVAIVDSGVDTHHPDLLGRVLASVRLEGDEFVPSSRDTVGHGTHLAGIIVGSGESSSGRIRGVAPGAKIVSIDLGERFDTGRALRAFEWIDDHRADLQIKIVVNAWSRTGGPTEFDPEDPLVHAANRLIDEGVIVVFAAGNDGPLPGSMMIDALNPRVITVGATDPSGAVLPTSARPAFGAKPDAFAVGFAVPSLRSRDAPGDPRIDLDEHHRVYSGTSQAAARVAGEMAVWLVLARATSNG